MVSACTTRSTIQTLHFTNSVFTCSVWFSQEIAITSLYSIQQFTLLNKAQFSVEYKLNLYIYNAVSLAFEDSVMAQAVCCWPQPLMPGYDPRPVHMRSLVKWWGTGCSSSTSGFTLLINTTLTKGQAGKTCGPAKQCSFGGWTLISLSFNTQNN